jgi:hypothetical protein
MEPTPRRLLCQVREAIRLKHYSIRTEQAYFGWLKRYIYFNGVRHPSETGDPEVESFLTVPPSGRLQPLAWSEAEHGVSPRPGSDRHCLRPRLPACLGP